MYRVYLPPNREDATFAEIGRSSNTGTGDVGQGYLNPSDKDKVVDGTGLPSGTNIVISSSSVWRQMKIQFPESSSSSRIGVFYATTTREPHCVTIPIIKISERGRNTVTHKIRIFSGLNRLK